MSAPTFPVASSAAGTWGSAAVASPLVCVISLALGASPATGAGASVVSFGRAGMGSAASPVCLPL